MVGFITLRGSLSGSIRLTTVGKSTRFVLKLREKPPRGGFTVYLIDGEDFASFRFSDDSDEFSGTALFSCVRAAVIANPFGDFIAEGSIGAVRHDLQSVKARIRAAAFSKERNAMQRNRHDSTQCTADLQISGHSAENSKHLSAAVSGRAGGTEPGKSGQKRRDMRPSEKKRSLRTLPCRRTACSPQNLPLRKESSAKRKNCLREAEFPQQTTIPPRIRILPFTVPILMRISVPFAKTAPARTKARPKTRSRSFFPTRIGKTPKRPPSVRQSSRSRRNVRHHRRAECKPPSSRRSLRKPSPRSFKQRQLVLARDTP